MWSTFIRKKKKITHKAPAYVVCCTTGEENTTYLSGYVLGEECFWQKKAISPNAPCYFFRAELEIPLPTHLWSMPLGETGTSSLNTAIAGVEKVRTKRGECEELCTICPSSSLGALNTTASFSKTATQGNLHTPSECKCGIYPQFERWFWEWHANNRESRGGGSEQLFNREFGVVPQKRHGRLLRDGGDWISFQTRYFLQII